MQVLFRAWNNGNVTLQVCALGYGIEYGFSVMEDKLKEDKGYFFSHRSFLDMFLQLTSKKVDDEHDEEEPEEL